MTDAAIKVSATFEQRVSERSKIVGMMMSIGGRGFFFVIGSWFCSLSYPIKLDTNDCLTTPGDGRKLSTIAIVLFLAAVDLLAW